MISSSILSIFDFSFGLLCPVSCSGDILFCVGHCVGTLCALCGTGGTEWDGDKVGGGQGQVNNYRGTEALCGTGVCVWDRCVLCGTEWGQSGDSGGQGQVNI